MAEMIKSIHVFLMKAANSLMPRHSGPPTAMSGGLIQILCEQVMEEWSTDAVTIDQTTNIVEKRTLIWRLTSLLVVTLPKFTLKLFAFSDACKSYQFLCNTSRHL